MYTVYLDNNLLFYPGDPDKIILNSKLDQALNECGTLDFDIPYDHPLYDSFELRKSMITVYKDDVEVFNGEVRELTPNMDFTKHVYAVGELAFLFDSIQPQAKYQNATPLSLFTAMLNQHNAQVEARKKFTLGMVTVTDPNNSLYRFTNYEDTLTAMREKMCDKLNGFLRIRKVNGTRYLDLVRLQDYGNVCEQEIEFGENLLDYSCDENAQNIATAVLPLGARQETSVVEGLDAYLTIKNATSTPAHSVHPSGSDYIYNSAAVGRFGYVKVVKHWDNITLPNNLIAAADNWLTDAQYATMTLEVTAFDESLINASVESYEIGDYITANAEPFGMHTQFPVQKKTTYLTEPEKNNVVLGSTMQKSYTKQASEAVALVEEQIPEESSLLEAAKQNAINILEGTEGGYLVFGFNNRDQIDSLSIMNAATEATATKKWVWNLGGFGYLYRNQISDDWTDLGLAMTMDGAIVADFITTGSMSATRIRGGVLYLGGSQQGAYKNGSLSIYDSSDHLIGSWSTAGISVKLGTITLGNKQALSDAKTGVYIGSDGISAGANSVFKVTSSGALNATSATISGAITAKSGAIGTGNNIWTIDGAAIRHGAVDSTADTSIAISAAAFSRVINNASRSCMLAIGSKFGVGVDGSVYATGANIAGSITATSGAIGNINIDGNGLNSIDNVNSAIRVDKAKGYLWQCRNGDSWGMFNTLPNNPPDAPWSGGKMTAYVHNGTFVVDNDGSLSEDGSTGSPNRMYITPFQVTKRYADGTTDVPIWVNYSDKRMKEDIEDITDEVVFEFFSKIHPKKYRFNEKSHNDTKPHHYGVIAQDIIEEFGEDVDFTGINESGYYHVNYREFHGIELAGIKSLLQTVERQQTEIDLLKAEINKLKEAVHGKY